jgi:hypothetical protein
MMLVGVPFDHWNTEDLSAAFNKIGKLLIWEKDYTHRARIIAKVRVTELIDIPKSIRFTEGDQPESESWTFSVEVLQETLLGGGPPDEDPLPDDGVDPHPIPSVGVQPEPFVGEADNNVEDVADNVDDWDHWAMPQNNNANVGENAVLPLPMELEGAAQNGQPANNQSSILLNLSSDASVGNSEEIIQPAVNQENNDEFFEPEAEHGPVIVHGNIPALNMDNFMQLGEGVQNVMLAYYDAEADAEANADVDGEDIAADAIIQEDPVNNNNHELVAMQIDNIADEHNGFLGGDNDFLEDVNLMDPEVAHLQVGLARTHFFPISEDM